LLKHLKVKHPEEAKNCLDASKHSGLHRAKRAIAEAAESGDQMMFQELGISGMHGPGLSTEAINRKFVLFCAYDLHPWRTVSESGCRLLVGSLPHSSTGSWNITAQTFDEALDREHANLVASMQSTLQRQRTFIHFGPCCSMQVDTCSVEGSDQVYAVMSVTFVNPDFQWRRLGLSVKALPRDYNSSSIESWVVGATAELFGKNILPSMAFLVCTVGNGSHLREAVMNLGVPHLMCSISSLEKAVRAGMAGAEGASVASFTARILKILAPLMEPVGNDELHKSLQRSLASTILETTQTQSLTNVLALYRRVLAAKPRMEQFYSEVLPSRQQLGETDWSTLQDAMGVLEACAEVDNGMRTAQVAPLAACASLVQELEQYLGEDTVYVPDLTVDPELHRLEKPAGELQQSVQRMRDIISKHLQTVSPGRMRSKEERLATLLNPCHKHDINKCTDVDFETAWAELKELYQGAASALHLSSAYLPSASEDGPEEDGTKRKWLSKYKQHKILRPSGDSCRTPVPMASDTGEVDYYQQLQSLDGDTHNSLGWWAEQGTSIGSDSGNPGHPSMVVLPLLAAQYHSIDPASVQASSLFAHVGFRMSGLRATEPLHKIEKMLLLRLNREWRNP